MTKSSVKGVLFGRALRLLQRSNLCHPLLDTIRAEREITGDDLRTAVAKLARKVRARKREREKE